MRIGPSEKEKYVEKLFAIEDECLRRIKSEIVKDGRQGMELGASEGRLLQVLMKMNSVETAVEVGTFLGYSTLWMARALPSNGKVFTLENNEKTANAAKNLLADTEVADRIRVIEGDALDSLKSLESEAPFDMIFIDANKSGYIKYLDWAEKNIKKGGLIVGDNTFLFGNVYLDEPEGNVSKSMHQAMREFNERLSDCERYDSILLPTSEGMTVAIKKF